VKALHTSANETKMENKSVVETSIDANRMGTTIEWALMKKVLRRRHESLLTKQRQKERVVLKRTLMQKE